MFPPGTFPADFPPHIANSPSPEIFKISRRQNSHKSHLDQSYRAIIMHHSAPEFTKSHTTFHKFSKGYTLDLNHWELCLPAPDLVYQQADLIALWRLTRRHDAMVRGENVCTVGVRPTEDRLMMALDGSDSWSPLNPTSPWNQSLCRLLTNFYCHSVHNSVLTVAY